MSAPRLMLVIAEDGFGKRLTTKEIKAKRRGGLGV